MSIIKYFQQNRMPNIYLFEKSNFVALQCLQNLTYSAIPFSQTKTFNFNLFVFQNFSIFNFHFYFASNYILYLNNTRI